NGTWASSIVARGTPSGRVRNAHSPVAVHRSYAIVSGTLIVVSRATDFTRKSTLGRSRRPRRPTNTYPETTKNVMPAIAPTMYPRYVVPHSRGCRTARADNGTRTVHQRPSREPA